MVEVRRVNLDELREQGEDLFAQHWREVGYCPDLRVNPDWKRLYAMEMGGGLLALGAFDGKQLVGYCATLLGAHHQCLDLFTATVDAIFVHPEYRRKGIAVRFLKETELAARERGARDLCWHSPQGNPLERLLCRRRYQVREVVYERAL